MKKLLMSAAITAALLLGASPAYAEHEDGHYAEPPAECDTSTDACQPAAEAEASDESVEPGEPVTVSTSGGTFAEGTTVEVGIYGEDGVVFQVEGVTVNADGSVSYTLTVPEGTPDDVYVLYIHGVDANGNPVVAMVDLVVLPGATTSGGFTASGVTAPAAVVAASAAMPADQRADAVGAVADGTGTVVLNNAGELELRTAASAAAPTVSGGNLSRTGSSIAGPVTAGIALVLVGGGMVILRRRPQVQA